MLKASLVLDPPRVFCEGMELFSPSHPDAGRFIPLVSGLSSLLRPKKPGVWEGKISHAALKRAFASAGVRMLRRDGAAWVGCLLA